MRMTLEELRAKVRTWDAQHPGTLVADSEYGMILSELEYHATRDWRVYLPVAHSDFNPSYMERLAAWIGNLTDETEQQLLLRYALFISFFSHDDFAALYKTALDREVRRWVVSQVGARLEPSGWEQFHELVHRQIHRQTWFCPITDSMDINEFYKVNHLQGVGHRPAFFTLQMLAEQSATPDPVLADNLRHYMANPSPNPTQPSLPLERIVLLEDIVGSGCQSLPVIRWAVHNLGKPVLFVPLILCPDGAVALRSEEARTGGQLTVRPIIELRESDLLGPKRPNGDGWRSAQDLEALASRCASSFQFEYPPFGFNDSGCSLATFSNTPDNTLPIVHNQRQSKT